MNYTVEIFCASVFTVVCIISAKIYSLLNEAYTYWDKRNVKGPKPSYIVGTWKGFAQKFLGNEDCANCTKYGKVFGTYDGLTPNLLIADPEVFEKVLVSSAESFQDLRFASENSVLLKECLLSLSGGGKSEIQLLTSSLLGPDKLEKLIPGLKSSAENLTNSIEKTKEEDGRVDITSCVTEFINDSVAFTIFGSELNADIQFKDEFVKNVQSLLTVKNPQSIWSILPFLYTKYFKEQWICPEKSLPYFVNLIVGGINEASTKIVGNGEKASNLIEVMVEAADEEKKLNKEGESEDIILKDDVIIYKCIASMLTLANATKTTVLFGINALANNEDVQEKLFREIEKNNSEITTFEDINNLTYLDKVVKEILRLYPFEFRVEKVATEKVRIGDIELDKEVRVSIPLYALHRLEDFYPEPEKFDPERFSLGASEKRNPFAYLPYGQACLNNSDVSLKLGVLAAKIALVKLVKMYKFSEAQIGGLHSYFQKGFTRIPKPEKIEVVVKSRSKNMNESEADTNTN